MKNNFKKIMDMNLNEDYNKIRNYYNTMYGYKRISDKKDPNEEKTDTKVEKSETRKKEIDNEIEKYLDKLDEIKLKYTDKFEELEDEISELELSKSLASDDDKIKKIDVRILNLKKKIDSLEKQASRDITTLNNSLKADVKKELRDNGEYVKSIEELDESSNIDLTLSVLEEKLIFNNTLSNIEDVLALDEATTVGNVNSSIEKANNAIKAASKAPAPLKGIAIQNAMNAASNVKNAQRKETIDNHNKNIQNQIAGKNDMLSGEKLKEATEPNSLIAAREKVIERKKEALYREKENDAKDVERKQRAIDAMENQLDAVKAKTKVVSSTQEQTPVSANEVLKEEPNVLKDKVDPNNLEGSLFSGKAGRILKYLISGSDSGLSILEKNIAGIISGNPESQVVIKKISFYSKKAASGLPYESYIDLKVQKGKFRELLKLAEKEYSNKYKK